MAINKKKDLSAKIVLELKRRRKEKKHKPLDARGMYLEDFSMGKISISDDYLGKPIG